MRHGGIALHCTACSVHPARRGPRPAAEQGPSRPSTRHTGLGPARRLGGKVPVPQACDLSASLTLVAQSTLVLSTVRGGSPQCPRDADGRAVCSLALVKRLRKSRWLKSILYLRLCFGSSRSLLFQQLCIKTHNFTLRPYRPLKQCLIH